MSSRKVILGKVSIIASNWRSQNGHQCVIQCIHTLEYYMTIKVDGSFLHVKTELPHIHNGKKQT